MLRGALLAIAVVGCSLPDGEYFGDVPSLEGRDPRHLRYCNSAEPESMDPAMATTTTASKLLITLFDGLYTYDENGLPEPSLATSMDTAPTLRRFTFHMRPEGRWSNGRTVDAHDFAYHIQRVLDPSTASPLADTFFLIKNGEHYVGNRVRTVLNDLPGVPAGSIVEVVAAGDKTGDDLADAPDPNLRTSSRPLALRDLGAAPDAAYRKVPAGTRVRIVELTGRPGAMENPADGTTWAYVYWPTGNDVYGWVPLADLDGSPNAAVEYKVRPVALRDQMGAGDSATAEELAAADAAERPTVTARGSDLLMLPEVLGIRVPDRFTLVIETRVPIPYILNIANQRVMRASPREAVARRPRRWAEPGTIVTSGGLTLVEWLERDRMEFVRSPTFWNQELVKLDKLTSYTMGDQSATTNFYFTGGCDATATNPAPATYMPVMNGEKRSGKPYKDFIIAPMNGTYYPIINAQKFPNRHFRRALAYAIDRSIIVRILKGGQIPTSQFSPGRQISTLSDEELALCGVTRDTPGNAMIMITGELCYVPPLGLDHDPEKARAELAIAKQQMGAAMPNGFTYRYNLGFEAHKLIAEVLQSAWQQTLGLDVKIEAQEWKTMVADATAGNYEVMRFGTIGNFPDAEAEFLLNFLCASTDNRPHWCNEEFDKTFKSAMEITDRKDRLRRIFEAEKLMIEDAPILPLYTYTQQFLIRPYVRGLPVNLVDQFQLERAWLDPDWRKHTQEARQ
jgi:oligopeptide transport system substrate-binding protein